jgi:DNA-binding MarR family transcriptional regulator
MSDDRNPESSAARRQEFGAFPERTRLLADLREVTRLTSEFERKLARILGIGPTDLAAMTHLMEAGPLSPSELARRLSITTAAATLLVHRLEGAGHATRAPHEDDRRRIVVTPASDSVQRAADELLPVVAGVAQASSGFAPDEVAVIERFLESVIAVYRNALTDPPSSPAR